jgi:hypothetical protein
MPPAQATPKNNRQQNHHPPPKKEICDNLRNLRIKSLRQAVTDW